MSAGPRTLAPMMPPLFFSTFMYAACKVVGNDAWPETLQHLLRHPDKAVERLGTVGYAFQTLYEAQHLTDCTVHVSSNTYIARARCVAAATFLASGRDVWLTVDDDNYADRDVLRRLVTSCRETRGLASIPYANRDGRSMTMRRLLPPVTRLACGELVMRIDRVGLGMTAMHRDFITALDRACPPSRRFRSRPAAGALDVPGIFLAVPDDGEWCGEDFYACALAERAGLPMHALLEAPVTHEHVTSQLDVDGAVQLYNQQHVAAMNRGIEESNEAARLAGIPIPAPNP
jgi:hypothetical protein